MTLCIKLENSEYWGRLSDRENNDVRRRRTRLDLNEAITVGIELLEEIVELLEEQRVFNGGTIAGGEGDEKEMEREGGEKEMVREKSTRERRCSQCP